MAFFFWRGRKEANGGHCLITWHRACRLKDLGGLGIHDLKSFAWALRMQWLWLAKTERDMSWPSFPIQVHALVRAFFSITMVSVVGDCNSILIGWKGRPLPVWLLVSFSPIPKRRERRRTVREALTHNRSGHWQWSHCCSPL